jgi:hypothetical protein
MSSSQHELIITIIFITNQLVESSMKLPQPLSA